MSPFNFRHKYVWVQIRDKRIWESAQQTLLLIEIGRSLHFDDVISLFHYLQERFLGIVCNDYIISFEDLLKKDNSF